MQPFGRNRHGPTIGEGLRPLFGEVGWVPIEHKVAWAEACLHTKWHLDVSSRFDTTKMGRKLGGSAPFLGGGADPHLIQSRVG